jgi:hypothetical protein
MMVSTIQKPEEHCELQPQRHCRLITKLVPHLTTKEVCNTVPKEICMLKLVNPHPVKKPIQLKWCTKKKPSAQSYGAPQPDEYGAPRPAPSGYLPAAAPQQFQQQQFQPQQFRPQGRSGAGTKEDPYVVDSGQFRPLQVPPSNIGDFSGGPGEPFRRVRSRRSSEVLECLLFSGEAAAAGDPQDRDHDPRGCSWGGQEDGGGGQEERRAQGTGKEGGGTISSTKWPCK